MDDYSLLFILVENKYELQTEIWSWLKVYPQLMLEMLSDLKKFYWLVPKTSLFWEGQLCVKI